MQCPECDRMLYGKNCSCGWSSVETIHEMSEEDKKRIRHEINRCWFKSNGVQCDQSAVIGGGKRTKMIYGIKVRGPWYCRKCHDKLDL